MLPRKRLPQHLQTWDIMWAPTGPEFPAECSNGFFLRMGPGDPFFETQKIWGNEYVFIHIYDQKIWNNMEKWMCFFIQYLWFLHLKMGKNSKNSMVLSWGNNADVRVIWVYCGISQRLANRFGGLWGIHNFINHKSSKAPQTPVINHATFSEKCSSSFSETIVRRGQDLRKWPPLAIANSVWREGQKTEVKGFKMSQTRSKSLNPPVRVEATDIPQQAQNQFRFGYYIYMCVCVFIYLYVYHDLSIYSYIGTYTHTRIYIYTE